MEINKKSIAGTLESGDIFIVVEKGEDGIDITLTSPVIYQYGDTIHEVINKTLVDLGVTNAKVVATDKGALDCTIRARVMTAVYRAAESEDYIWGE